MGSRNVIEGVNDLRTWCSRYGKSFLLEEWDYIKNKSVSPDTVSYASNSKVWWICPYGHSYDARVGNRTSLNRNCPYCSGKKVLSGYNDFESWCISNGQDSLLKEWDYEKNDIEPSRISRKNSKKVWWKCSRGHEWSCTIGSRTSKRPSGCPYCSNPPKRILAGFNDFESWCVNNGKDYLLKEWDKEKNAGVSPKEITFGSGKRVWWTCNRGHSWCVSPANRVRGTGCPVCSRTQTSFPEQAMAYYLSKSFIILQRYRIEGFEIDVFLEQYGIGIEYDGMFFHTDDSVIREKEKDTFYAEKNIRLIHVKENLEKSGFEGNVLFFVPKKSNYLDNSFNDMLLSLVSCLGRLTGVQVDMNIDVVRDELFIREHYAAVVKKNSVAAVFPWLLEEWDTEKNNGLTPDNFAANAHTKVWWRCKNGHSWQADISSRSRKLGCPYCAGQKTILGVNDLESWCIKNMPELLLEWNNERNLFRPSEIAKTSNKKVWWKCSKGHEWEAAVANRVHGTRCPYCFSEKNTRKRKLSFGDWCRENNKENLIKEWNYDKNGCITPNTVSKASHEVVWWKCSEGHEWEAQIKSRTYNHGCPYCSSSNKKAIVGVNDLATWCKKNDKQYILDEWDYNLNGELKPEMFTFGSHKRVNWKCSKGHEWSAVIKERTKYNGNMCPECKK